MKTSFTQKISCMSMLQNVSALRKTNIHMLTLYSGFTGSADLQSIFRNFSKKSIFKFKVAQICYDSSYCRDISCTYTFNLFLQAEKVRKLFGAIHLALGLVKLSLKWPSGRPFYQAIKKGGISPGGKILTTQIWFL